MELTFPESYPNSPPRASFYTEIPYHGGATKRDDQGRIQLCLNILADFAHVHTEWEHDKDASGWSSAYTVHTILLNLQAFLLDVPNCKDATTTRLHVTIAVPNATAASLGIPDNNKMGGAWIMGAGTTAAHIMTPGS